jgi:glucose/arabinose dehydrogenase
MRPRFDSVRGWRMSGHGLMIEHKPSLAVSLALLLGLLLSIFVFNKLVYGAGTLPSGFTQESFAGGLIAPTAMAFAPDGNLFVAEQEGILQLVKKDGTLQKMPQGTPAPFLDISGKVNAVGERGLLDGALDPNFDPSSSTTTSNYVYIYYTNMDATVHRCASRFPASLDSNLDSNSNLVAGTEEIIFELPPLAATNHNGGAVHFGADGELYVAVGGNARLSEAQSLNSVLGKILRINKDGTTSTDNPFYAQTTDNNRAIWALGLRNPYSFDIQPGTGRIFINDVGQSTWEEINDGISATNYGWPIYEGPFSYTPSKSKKGRHKKRRFYTGPLLYSYPHSAGCAITGGSFYNPRQRLNPRSRLITLAATSSRTSVVVGSISSIPR